jgi:hypothetical protein
MNQHDFVVQERASRDTIDVKRAYILMAGDISAGVLLSQIIYWHLPDKKGNQTKLTVKRNNYLWLAKKRDDWWNEICMLPKQFDRAIKDLEKRNEAIINDDAPSFDSKGGKWNFPDREYPIALKGKMEIDQEGISETPRKPTPAVAQTLAEKDHRILTENTTENLSIPICKNLDKQSDDFSPESSPSSLSGTLNEDDTSELEKLIEVTDDVKLVYVQTIVDYFNGLKGRYPDKINAKINRPKKASTVVKFSEGRYRTILKWFKAEIPAYYICDALNDWIPKLKTSIGGSLNYFENKEVGYLSPADEAELERYKKELLGDEDE